MRIVRGLWRNLNAGIRPRLWGAVLSAIGLCASTNFALAESNTHTFSCIQGFSSHLCKAGGGQSCTSGTNNAVDILNITGVSTGSVITFNFTTTSQTLVATTVEISGQGNTGDPTPSSLTVPASSNYTVTAADAVDGQSDFQVKLTNNPVGQGEKAAADYTVTCVPPPPKPSWKLVKTPSPTTYTAAGQLINYSYTLTNTGNVTINSITVSDNKIASVSCPVSTLAPGASTTCTGSYTTTSADVTNGSVTNTATAHGTPTAGTLADATAQATINLLAQPSWKLVKTPSPSTYTAAGQLINYSYTLTNTGNVTINSITVSDNKIASVSCPVSTLAPGASTTCTGSYTTTANDVTTGSVTNTATAHGTPTSGNLADAPAQATINFLAQPSWKLVKTPSPSTYTAAGQAINYSYALTNTGNVTINSITISDNKIAAVSCPVSTLAPGASTTCTGSYTTTANDVTTGSVTNTATAHGTPTSGNLADAPAQATINFLAQPSWKLVKTPSPSTYTAAGQAINYSYALTNTGNVTINSITISDNKIAAVSC